MHCCPRCSRCAGKHAALASAGLVGWLAIGVFIALPLLLLVLFVWQSDAIARGLAKRISIEQELQLGERMFESIRGQLKLTSTGPRHDAVALLGGRLTKGSKFRYRFHVAEDDTINAFAVPGGIIVVHTGLIAATRSAEELAGVLAHEVQHIEQRHSLTGIIKQLGLSGLWLLIGGDATGILGSAAVELTSLRFSRDAETQADAGGFDALVAAGIDPRGMPQFFVVMREREKVVPPPFLSTHPGSAEREAMLRERLRKLGDRTFEPLPFEQWPPG